MKNIHASCVSLNQKGILLLGKSGAGKSDLVLRLIEQTGAILVADDRVDLAVEKGNLFAICPQNIEGLLEVRGLGIIKKPFAKKEKVDLVVELVGNFKEIERLPKVEYESYESVKIKKIKLFPFEISAAYKIKAACDENNKSVDFS